MIIMATVYFHNSFLILCIIVIRELSDHLKAFATLSGVLKQKNYRGGAEHPPPHPPGIGLKHFTKSDIKNAGIDKFFSMFQLTVNKPYAIYFAILSRKTFLASQHW